MSKIDNDIFNSIKNIKHSVRTLLLQFIVWWFLGLLGIIIPLYIYYTNLTNTINNGFSSLQQEIGNTNEHIKNSN